MGRVEPFSPGSLICTQNVLGAWTVTHRLLLSVNFRISQTHREVECSRSSHFLCKFNHILMEILLFSSTFAQTKPQRGLFLVWWMKCRTNICLWTYFYEDKWPQLVYNVKFKYQSDRGKSDYGYKAEVWTRSQLLSWWNVLGCANLPRGSWQQI